MTTTVEEPTLLASPQIPLDRIRVHPQNPRRDAVADSELIASVKAIGIVQAVTVAPDPHPPTTDGQWWMLIGGHRRHDAATKVGLTTIPGSIRSDLTTEAQQLEAMLVENLHRLNLTPIEEADGYTQLELFGLDEKAIAAATGRSRTTVKARMRLTRLGDLAKDKLHAGDITLIDATALLEFEDDPTATADLEQALGTDNWDWKLREARDRVTRAQRHGDAIAEFEALGATKADGTDGFKRLIQFHDNALGEASGHTDCLGYVWHGIDSHVAPYLVCLDPTTHDNDDLTSKLPVPDPKPDAAELAARAEQEAREEQRAKARLARRAADQVRFAWLAEHWGSLLATGGAKQRDAMGEAARATMTATLADLYVGDFIDTDALGAALGYADPALDDLPSWERARVYTKHQEALAAKLPGEPVSAAIPVLAAFLASVTATCMNITVYHEYGTTDPLMRALAIWDWAEAAGYPMSDPDRERVTEIITALEGEDA